jgi:ribonuclease BN (tRNA processing enzyme)
MRTLLRRSALATTIGVALATAGIAQMGATGGGAPSTGTTLTLLGTAGGPGGMADRAGIASLVTVDGRPYVIDAGEGVSRQLARAGIHEPMVSTVFLTHLHDDHTAGLPGLASFAYTLRSKGMQIIGPPSTKKLVAGILAYMQPNVDIRGAERPLPAPATIITAREIGTGPIYKDDRVTVDAVENTHFHLPAAVAATEKSLSYRFRTKDRTIVFTGDTGPSEAVDRLAKGADVLVSEIVSAADIAHVPPDVRAHMLQEHLTAADVGKLATRAGVKTVVLSHLRTIAPADVAEVQRHFAGRVVAGQDLQTF